MSKINDASLLHEGRTGFEKGADVLRDHLKTLPPQPGVYRMVAINGSVLYVGKAKNLKKRVSSYTQHARLPYRLQRMVAQTHNLEIVITHTEAEALLLEANFIQRFMPPFNVLLRDDKSYPYILITRPPALKLLEANKTSPKPLAKVETYGFPQLVKHRGKKNRNGWYFGPFASGGAVNETITLLQRGFMLRNCSDSFFAARTRPCLQYHIKRCTAPCVAKVSLEDYGKQVEEARAFLKGKTQEIQQMMAADMQRASDNLDFEMAAKLRDRIRTLTSIQARQDIHVGNLDDADVMALHQQGGRTAIQVFFFRSGRNYGARTIYPSHDRQVEISEILSSFIAQFYVDKDEVPPTLLLSHQPNDAEVLEQALTEQSGHKVSISVPQLGDKKRLIEHARKNAEEALARTMAESSEQAKLLRRVAEIFGLAETPKRIEVYDNSHISGSHAIGAMVAAGPEGFLKKTYRKFNIRNEQAGGDDYAMMSEVLTRRFRRLIDEDPTRQSGMWPDMLLIDGGAGQLSSVQGVLNELGITDMCIVGVAKGPDRNAGKERFFMSGKEPFSLAMDDPALYYLQRLRDEAHRFAIGTHRAKRVKAIGQSGLEDIPGIGALRKRALLHHFGSAKAVAGAALEDLARVPGISLNVARKIHDYFRERG